MSIWKNGKLVAGGRQVTPLLSSTRTDHILDDISWLRADTFSWQRGSVYQAAYQHLVGDCEVAYAYRNSEHTVCWLRTNNPQVGDLVYNNWQYTTSPVSSIIAYDESTQTITIAGNWPGDEPKTFTRFPYSDELGVMSSETIGGTTVRFFLADDGHKICPASEESNVMAIYNATGAAWYYIIDVVNERFKLPRKHSQQIVRSVKNADGSWYRLYADGWVEQGGKNYNNTIWGEDITLPIEMASATYTATASSRQSTRDDAQSTVNRNTVLNWSPVVSTQTKTTIHIRGAGTESYYEGFNWYVCGMSSIDMSSFQDDEKYLYFYMGQFTQTALENTAGINTELFNGKADTDLSNVNSTGKTVVVGWVMPDWQNAQHIDISIKNNPYTITENGYYVMVLNKDTANADARILVNGIAVAVVSIGASWESTRVTLPLCVGDIVSSSGSVYSASISHYVPIKGLSA